MRENTEQKKVSKEKTRRVDKRNSKRQTNTERRGRKKVTDLDWKAKAEAAKAI